MAVCVIKNDIPTKANDGHDGPTRRMHIHLIAIYTKPRPYLDVRLLNSVDHNLAQARHTSLSLQPEQYPSVCTSLRQGKRHLGDRCLLQLR